MTKPAWKDAEDEFASYWSGKDQWVYKFEDTREAMGNTGKSRKVFTKARPSDFLVVDRGSTFFAEVKSSEDHVSFNLNNIATGQWTAAIRSVAAGGHYYFFLKMEVLGYWYKVPASVLVEQRNTKKSIKWTELIPHLWKVKNGN